MSWVELSLNTTNEAVDWVCTLLTATKYKDDIHVTKYIESQSSLGHEDAIQSKWKFTIHLYIDNDVYLEARVEEIVKSLLPLHRAGLCDTLQEAVVENKPTQIEGFSPLVQHIGQRFVILTPDMPYESEAKGEVTLRLKTSLSFGSGFHPTTILSLRLLERYIVPTMKVLDFGSGSGILSVAMAKLGACVLAVDNDSIAVEATQDAVDRNQVEQQVTVMKGSLGCGSNLGHWMGIGTIDNVATIATTETFDLIVANIQARMHIALAPEFRLALRHHAHSGLLIASGFTTDYEDAVTATFIENGFEAIDCERLDEWVAFVYRRIFRNPGSL